jgi:hypothetical protein
VTEYRSWRDHYPSPEQRAQPRRNSACTSAPNIHIRYEFNQRPPNFYNL